MAFCCNKAGPRLMKALAPKVWDGRLAFCINSHRPPRGYPPLGALDFFVCFSSTASLLGNVAQANYAAANAFLDAFAAYRQAQKLPALTINWSAWSEVGGAASPSGTDTAAGCKPGGYLHHTCAGSSNFGEFTHGKFTGADVAPSWRCPCELGNP